jgi:hypothetical protein
VSLTPNRSRRFHVHLFLASRPSHLLRANQPNRVEMTFALRDTQPTVVYLDTDLIRAGLGEGELFNRPTMVSLQSPALRLGPLLLLEMTTD